MKLILSRKGFDASWGGCASPIAEDDSLLSLPIPDRASSIRYRDIRGNNGDSIAPIVAQLSRGRIRAGDRAHLDPDLRSSSLRRLRGWRPLFGQAAAAQAHLARHQVGAGDVFLFFGWFRRVERKSGRFQFVRGAPDLHVIFGWMQVGQVVEVSATTAARMPWAAYHPHLVGTRCYSRNTLYVASPRIDTIGVDLPGGGVFPRFQPRLCLTNLEPYEGRSSWRLPRGINPDGRPALSRHGDCTRWLGGNDFVRLRSVPIGQEFVLDLDAYPEAREWLRDILGSAAS
jgi:hypothetical protein